MYDKDVKNAKESIESVTEHSKTMIRFCKECNIYTIFIQYTQPFQVNEAEKERMESETEHRKTMIGFQEAETRVQFLQKELKRAIAKSK